MAKKIEGSIASDNASVYWIVGAKRMEVKIAELDKEIIARAIAHGINQKVRDSAASALTDAERVSKMEGAIENLMKGIWNGGGGGNSLLAEALAKLKGLAIEDAIALVAKMDDVQRKLIEKNPKVKLAVNEIQMERLAAKAKAVSDDDLDDLLDL